MHDKTLFFFDRKALAAANNTEITSKLIDMRFNGDDVDGRLFINAQLGAAPSEGVVRFKVLTSYDGSSWVDLLTVNNSGATLYKGRLPRGIRDDAQHGALQALRAEREHAREHEERLGEKAGADGPLQAPRHREGLGRALRLGGVLRTQRLDAAEVAQVELDGEHGERPDGRKRAKAH